MCGTATCYAQHMLDTRICTHIHMHMYMHTHAHTLVHTYGYAYVYEYTQQHMHTNRTCTHIRVRKHTYTYAYVHKIRCMYTHKYGYLSTQKFGGCHAQRVRMYADIPPHPFAYYADLPPNPRLTCATSLHTLHLHTHMAAAMRSAGVKPNAATTAAFAAGLLTVTGRYMPETGRYIPETEHPSVGVSAKIGGWTQAEGGRQDEDVPPTLHAVAARMRHGARQGTWCGHLAARGPRASEMLRGMLALNMRPDAATCVSLLRATAAAHGAGVSECLRLIEAMRGAGAAPSREWYLTAAAAARTVTEGLYLARMSREHLHHGLVETAVCQQLLRSLCGRCDFDGIAQVAHACGEYLSIHLH